MDFKALVTAQLNANNAESELKNLCKDRDINLKVKIDDNEIKNLARKISKDKSFQITAHLKDTSLKNIQHQLESMVKGMNIDLSKAFNVNSPTNPAKKYGQQVGNVISQSAEKAISNVSSKVIGNGFKVSKGMSDKVESEIESIVKDMTNGKGKVSKITINTKTSFNKKTLENVEELKSATVQYTNAAGEAITKTLQWERIGTDKSAKKGQKAVMGWRESTAKYTKSVEEASKATANFENTQKKTANRLSNQTKQIYKSAIDPNASKTIKEQTHLDDLENRYKDINTEIGKLSGLTGSAFVDQENHINDLITDLKIVKKSYQDAESTATSLRSKPIDVVQDEVSKKVKGLEADIKKAGVSSKDLTTYITKMNEALKNPIDATGINDVLNTYSKASAELAKLKKQASAQQSLEKAQIKSNGLISEIEKAKVDNTGLENFKATINGVEVSANDLINSLNEVKTSGDVSVLSEQWKSFTSQAKQAGVMAEKAVDNAKKISSITKDFVTGKYSATSKEMSSKLLPFGEKDIESITKAKKYLKEYNDAYAELENHFNGKNVLSNSDLIVTFDKLETSASGFKNAIKEVTIDTKGLDSLGNSTKKLQERLESIKNTDTSKFENASAYQKMTNYIKDAEEAMSRFNAEKEKGENANFSVLTKEMKEVESATKKAETQYKNLYAQVNKLDATTASNKALSWLNNNNKVYKDKNLSGAIESIAHQLKEVTVQGEFDSLQKGLNDYIAQAQAAGLTGKSWMSGFKQSFGAIAQFTGIYGVLQNVIEEIPRQMVQYVADVDAEMTNLQMATGATDAEAKELMKTYSEMGKELKTLGTDIAASSTEWLKQGKSIQEAQKLTKDSIVLSKIGDMSSEDATKTITAAMKSYELAESEVMGFIDQISAIDMVSATDVSGLSNAFNEVAANAKVAGVETEKLLSYAAVIGETSQEEMASVGTALNAIFSRMGNIKLSRLKDYENGEEDLSNVETVLKKNSIALRDAAGQFREFDDVLAETASKWEQFDSVTQRAVANAFSGTNHANSFMILMENWGNVEKYVETAVKSSGESMEKFSEYQSSLEGSVEGFKNAFQDLSNTTLDSDFLKGIVDTGTNAIEVLDWLIDKIGLLGTIGAGVGIGALIKNFGNSNEFCPLWV